jgi:hypothetical protein
MDGLPFPTEANALDVTPDAHTPARFRTV